MRRINPKSNNSDSFKYSILISLHYYDIPYHREKTSKLDAFANKYNFNDTNSDLFEKNKIISSGIKRITHTSNLIFQLSTIK